MMESQQRLRDELHSHTSLIHSLRCAEANASINMLGRLRQGDYDSALLGTDHGIRSTSPGDRIYPWEESGDEGHHHQPRSRSAELLPSIDGFAHIRHDAGNIYSSSHDKPDHAYDHRAAAMHPQGSSSNFAGGGPHGNMTSGGGVAIMPNSDPRMAYQRAEMQQYQPRGNHGYQHAADMSLHPPLPSKDPTRNFPGPR
jgi:hypothetical protein